MSGPSKSKETAQRTTGSSRLRYGATFLVTCFLLYALVMLGGRVFPYHIGVIGGLLAIAGVFIASRWYDQRKRRNAIEVLPPGPIDDHSMKSGVDRTLSVMLSKRTETDFLRDDQRSNGKEPYEPIFGPGAAPFLAQLTISVGALALTLLVLLLANSAKEKASGLLFGGSQRSQPLEPGRSTVIDGYKFKRID